MENVRVVQGQGHNYPLIAAYASGDTLQIWLLTSERCKSPRQAYLDVLLNVQEEA